MPTATGAETIGERLKRLRTQLARTRATMARAEDNGQANTILGTQVTEIAYERALAREAQLGREIAALEARLAGSTNRPGLARLATKFD